MRPDPQDRSVEPLRPSRPSMGLILAGLAIAGALAWFLLFRDPVEPEPPPEPPSTQVTPPPITPAPELPPAPDIPEPPAAPEPEPVVEEPEVPPVPPPSLDTSDAELRVRLDEATDSQLVEMAAGQDHLVERLVGSIDSLSRGVREYKILPMPSPPGKFTVAPAGGAILLDPANYRRYDAYAQMVENLDTELLVTTFHRFRPLLEQAYAELGYEADDFDNTVIRMLDHILATPALDGATPVIKDEAIYRYADPELEGRSDLQKQLMRIGPENLARVQRQAANLRRALLEGG